MREYKTKKREKNQHKKSNQLLCGCNFTSDKSLHLTPFLNSGAKSEIEVEVVKEIVSTIGFRGFCLVLVSND